MDSKLETYNTPTVDLIPQKQSCLFLTRLVHLLILIHKISQFLPVSSHLMQSDGFLLREAFSKNILTGRTITGSVSTLYSESQRLVGKTFYNTTIVARYAELVDLLPLPVPGIIRPVALSLWSLLHRHNRLASRVKATVGQFYFCS